MAAATRRPGPESRFHERRPVSRGLLAWNGALLIVTPLVYVAWRGGGWMDALTVVAVLLIALIPFGWLAFGPSGWELRHITVDDRGLWLRRRLLPAERIGRVEALSRGQATGAYTLLRRRHGLRRHPRRSSANPWWMHADDAAVMVEDSASQRAWLVATRRPDELRRALDAVRPSGADRPRSAASPDGEPRPADAPSATGPRTGRGGGHVRTFRPSRDDPAGPDEDDEAPRGG